MAYLAFHNGESPSLELISASEQDNLMARELLIDAVTNLDGEPKTRLEAYGRIGTNAAEPLSIEMAAELMAKSLIGTNLEDVQLMDAETGLALSSTYFADGETTLEPSIFEVEHLELDAGSFEEEPVLADMVLNGTLNAYSYQEQPIEHEGTVYLLEHQSVGSLDQHGAYRPFATLLDSRHPARCTEEN